MSLPLFAPVFSMARWVFARLLGAVFFCAFASVGWQIRGLAGTRGINPAQDFLDAVWHQLGAEGLWRVPTLCWISAGDGMLVSLCLAGVAISVVLMCGFFPGLCTLLLWVLYLSLCWVTTPFLGFQWDALLLETALLSTVFLPWRMKPDWRRWNWSQHAARWMLWWLLFRLMFQSGVVKLASKDPTWSSLTALDYHFETQPLPLWTSWLVQQMPEWTLCLATAVMFLIEFAAPVLIPAPRRWRHGAAWALIALQVIILATGNYAFFNYLTIGLCLLLFDDRAWPLRWRNRLGLETEPAEAPRPEPWVWWIIGPIVTLLFLITVQPLASSLGLGEKWPLPFRFLRQAVEPTMSFNGYGLFAVMTTSRHEISIEGSDDGTVWKEYEFPWKPGDVRERPKMIAPFQPRLDWQMWFAALGSVRDNPWFVNFLARLLEGSPAVQNLLATDPFPDHPPKMIRAVLYDYHFTRWNEGSSAWWKRESLGLYCPPITLDDGHPALVK